MKRKPTVLTYQSKTLFEKELLVVQRVIECGMPGIELRDKMTKQCICQQLRVLHTIYEMDLGSGETWRE